MSSRFELLGANLCDDSSVTIVGGMDDYRGHEGFLLASVWRCDELVISVRVIRVRGDSLKVLVAYMSSTGNTKKIAEAIYGEIAVEKEMKPVSEVEDLGAYDLSFLGFPTHGYGPDKKTKALMEKLCTDGKKVALFVTHAAPEDEPDVSGWMEKFKHAAAGAELIGSFDCQGELSKGVKFIMKISPNKEMRSQAGRDNSHGQPDESRLAKARAFARDTLNRMV
jgi:flavodoxin